MATSKSLARKFPPPPPAPAQVDTDGGPAAFFSPTPGEAWHPDGLAIGPTRTRLVAVSFRAGFACRIDVISLNQELLEHERTLVLPIAGAYRASVILVRDDLVVVGATLKSHALLVAYDANTGGVQWVREFDDTIWCTPFGLTNSGSLCVGVLSKRKYWSLLTLAIETGESAAEPWMSGLVLSERIAWNPSSQRLLAHRRDWVLHEIDPISRNDTPRITESELSTGEAVSPSGDRMAVARLTTVDVHSLETNTLVGHHEGTLAVGPSAFSPDRRWLVTSHTRSVDDHDDARVEIAWRDASDGTERARVRLFRAFSIWGLGFDARGRCLVYVARGAAQLPHGIVTLLPPE
jgi:hypothetical protein